MQLLWQVAGLALGTTGVAALYLSWKRKGAGPTLMVAGWALVAASIVAWSQTSGIDEGPALGILSIVLIGLMVVAVSALRTPAKPRRTARARMADEDGRSVAARGNLTKALLLFVIVGLGFVVSVAACAALFLAGRSAGFEHTANLAVTMFTFPLVWAGLATWLGYSSNPVRGGAILAAVFTLALVVIGPNIWGA